MELEEHLDDVVVELARVLDAGDERRQATLTGRRQRVGARHVERREHCNTKKLVTIEPPSQLLRNATGELPVIFILDTVYCRCNSYVILWI